MYAASAPLSWPVAVLSRRDGARLFSAAFFPLPNALAYGEP